MTEPSLKKKKKTFIYLFIFSIFGKRDNFKGEIE